MSIVQIKNLSKIYGHGENAVTAVDNISLEIKAGESVALTGPSGSGKTTLLNLLAGFDKQTNGDLSVLSKSMSDLNEAERTIFRRKNIGVVFQDFNLLNILTVKENLILPLALNNTNKNETDDLILNILETAKLSDKINSYPDNLSAGQRQRIAILRALISPHPLLLLDEPTNCLDSDNTDSIVGFLLDICKQKNSTLIIASHDIRVTEKLSRKIELVDGKIIDDRSNN